MPFKISIVIHRRNCLRLPPGPHHPRVETGHHQLPPQPQQQRRRRQRGRIPGRLGDTRSSKTPVWKAFLRCEAKKAWCEKKGVGLQFWCVCVLIFILSWRWLGQIYWIANGQLPVNVCETFTNIITGSMFRGKERSVLALSMQWEKRHIWCKSYSLHWLTFTRN